METHPESDQTSSTILLRPDQKGSGIPETLTLPIPAFLEPMPPDRISSGYLELGEWQGDEYERDFQVEFYLAQDGTVWAKVGPLAEIPLLPREEREKEACRILADFLAAYADWFGEHDGEYLLPETLQSWPSNQLTAWMYEAASNAPAPMSKLMNGVLAEIKALEFQVEPEPQAPK